MRRVTISRDGSDNCHERHRSALRQVRQDIQSTLRIRDAGQLLGIQVSDHIIVAGDHYLSMLERGIL
ncbi:MAG: JAB domain-containing protein [Coprococcus sp.]